MFASRELHGAVAVAGTLKHFGGFCLWLLGGRSRVLGATSGTRAA